MASMCICKSEISDRLCQPRAKWDLPARFDGSHRLYKSVTSSRTYVHISAICPDLYISSTICHLCVCAPYRRNRNKSEIIAGWVMFRVSLGLMLKSPWRSHRHVCVPLFLYLLLRSPRAPPLAPPSLSPCCCCLCSPGSSDGACLRL